MLVYTIVVTLLLFFLTLTLFFSVKKNLELNDKIEDLANQLEESLDILNNCYQRISKACETEVLSDEPLVKRLIQDIKHAKHAILLIANKIMTFNNSEDDEQNQE